MQKKQFTNHLIHETSPYLLQHAHNPVNWYAWNSEALAFAKNLDKPILLSIGYSACHWCHVMAHESFENTDIAAIMNEHFINIKVDREERPDLDDIYMTSVQLMTGRGGWPMTVFLTPDLEPFYGGTYFPPVDRMGIPGFPQILNSVAEYYKEQKHKIKNDTAKLKSSMHHISNIQKADEKTVLDKNFLNMTAKNILSLFDTENGGFGLAPKFPQSMTLKFLMRMYLRTKDPTMLEAIDISLMNMACGGIYDHLGGGFHRYAVDAEWQVPHFEKMLYDNALLASCYLEGYTLTHRLLFKQIAIETLEYCLREMQDAEGGFYSAQDADSEGEEGKHFVWTQAEIYKILGKEEGQLFSEYFQINQFGNFENGYSTLHRVRNEDLFLKKHNLFKNSWDQKVKSHKQLLLEKRRTRPSPSTDKKILTSWNALLVSALIKAYYITQERRFLTAAQKTIEFAQDHLIFQKNRLHRTCKDGVSKISGYLEDYSLFLSALLDIYEVTGNSDYFSQALQFNEIILQQFWDKNNGAFFFTSSDHEPLLLRSKNIYDNATPSGNSVQVMNLLRLYKITGKTELLDKAETTLKAFLPYLASSPSGFSEMLCALDFYFGPVLEIAIINPATQTKITNLAGSEIAELFIPNKVMAICQMENEHHPDVVLLKNKSAMNNQPTFYLCQNFTCQNPTTSLQELKQSITANLNPNQDLGHADR